MEVYAGLQSGPLEKDSPPPPELARPHQCNVLAISVPGVAAPFKGSSQHARLMQREGRLKPRQPGNVALKQQLGKKRSQIISLPSAIPLSGMGGWRVRGFRVWRWGGKGIKRLGDFVFFFFGRRHQESRRFMAAQRGPQQEMRLLHKRTSCGP